MSSRKPHQALPLGSAPSTVTASIATLALKFCVVLQRLVLLHHTDCDLLKSESQALSKKKKKKNPGVNSHSVCLEQQKMVFDTFLLGEWVDLGIW